MATPIMSATMFEPRATDQTAKSAKYQGFDYFDETPEVNHFSVNAESETQEQIGSNAKSKAYENSSGMAS